jgi:microcystin-dependent protein
MRTPDITADEATITHTIGGQLDLGEWTVMPDGTRRLLVPNRIINVCDPDDDQDVATKKYVDTRAGSGSGTNPIDPQTLVGPKGDRGPAGPAGPLGPVGFTGPVGPQGIQGGAGPTGLNGAFAGRGDPGPPGPTGIPGSTGSRGTQGTQGSTGSVGPQGIQGSSGLILYLNPSGDSLADVSIIDSYLMSTINVNFTTRALSYTIPAGETMPLTYFWNLRTSITQAQSSIPGGEVWTMNVFAKPVSGADVNNVGLAFKLFRITSTDSALAASIILDTGGNVMPPRSLFLPSNVISVGTVSTTAVLDSTAIKLYKMSLEVPFTDISDPQTYLQVQIYATNLSSNRTHYCKLYFQNTSGGFTDPDTNIDYTSTYSYLRTSLGAAGIQGALGPQGPQGVQGSTGAQGTQGYPGTQGIQGAQGDQGPPGIQGPRGIAAGPPKAIQFKDANTQVLSGSDYLTYDVSNNGGTMFVPNITMQTAADSVTGSMITPHRIDTSVTDDTVAPLYLNTGAYDGVDAVGFLTVGLKSDTVGGVTTTSRPKDGGDVNFGFKTFYGKQTMNTGGAQQYTYRLARCNEGSAKPCLEIAQSGSAMNLNADRIMMSASDPNATYALHDLVGPDYTPLSSYMLSTRVWKNNPVSEPAYPVWISCHQGITTYSSTGAMIKMNPSEILFTGAVTFAQGFDSAGAVVNLNTDVSGTMNIGASSKTINVGSQSNAAATVINIGGPGDTVNVAGTLTYVNTTNLDISDNLITLNKGATHLVGTYKGAGIQISRPTLFGGDDNPGWIKTDTHPTTGGSAWEIVPPVAGATSNVGNGLMVCNIANTNTIQDPTTMLIGLQTVKESNGSGPNLVLKQDGNVGIGYKYAITITGFPQSPLHIETTGGNQIILGSGADPNGGDAANNTRLFLSSPSTSNGYLIMGVGSGSGINTNAKPLIAAAMSTGFRLQTDIETSILTLNCINSTTPLTALTFTRSDGSTLFSGHVNIDSDKYFRMYNGAKSSNAVEATSFEINGSNGATRIGKNTTVNTTAGSLVLGSHLILNGEIGANNAVKPTGVRGLIRFNDDNKSAEIYDGSYWVDVGYYAGTPLGAIIAYPSATAPSASFKLCNGETLSKTGEGNKYADLFTIIGYTYSATKSGDNFQLPDIQGRTIVGFNESDTAPDAFKPLGATGGAKRVALSTAEMPAHKHTVAGPETFPVQVGGTTQQAGSHSHTATDSGHTHYSTHSTNSQWVRGDWDQVSAVEPFYSQKSETSVGKAIITVDASGVHTHPFGGTGTAAITYSDVQATLGLGTTNTGGSASHNNLQPYIVLNYFIKVVRDSKQYNSTSAVASDIRVKRNIVPLKADQAIESIRGLQPKRYEYIDRNMSAFAQHIGFIAQEVKLCIPESVRTKREYIPNIYSMAKMTSSEKPGNALLTSVQHPIVKLITEQLILNLDSDSCTSLNTNISIKGTKLKMFNKSKECFYVCCVESIDDYNIMVEPLDAVTTAKILSADYFVYGQEIEDYHYMNNDAVFSTLVSAFQALDKKCNQQEILLNAIISKYGLTLAS